MGFATKRDWPPHDRARQSRRRAVPLGGAGHGYGVAISRRRCASPESYVLGVPATSTFRSWENSQRSRTAEALAQGLEAKAWTRLSAGAGSKGERLYDWAYLPLADLEAEAYGASGLWTRGLLVRRHPADGTCAYFTTWCPAGTTLETLVAVEGQRWTIEDSFETVKTELGLDHNETRSWHGWHRHVSLAMLAFAMLATIRHRANATAPKKIPLPMTRMPRSLSTGRSRRSAAWPRGWPNAASNLPMSLHGRSGDAPIKRPQNDRCEQKNQCSVRVLRKFIRLPIVGLNERTPNEGTPRVRLSFEILAGVYSANQPFALDDPSLADLETLACRSFHDFDSPAGMAWAALCKHGPHSRRRRKASSGMGIVRTACATPVRHRHGPEGQRDARSRAASGPAYRPGHVASCR